MAAQSTSLSPGPDVPDDAAGVRCIDCGYDLQATPGEGACPECGLAVAASANQSEVATLRSCFVAACRLFTVWLVVYSMQYLVSLMLLLFYWDRSSGAGWMGSDVIDVVFSVVGPLVLNAVAVVVVWFAAPWLARIAVRRDRPFALGAGMRALDMYCVGLCLIGVWFCVNAALDIVYVVAEGFEASRRYAADQFGTKVSTEEWVTFLASIVAGVFLIRYGRRRLPAWPIAGTPGAGCAATDAPKD